VSENLAEIFPRNFFRVRVFFATATDRWLFDPKTTTSNAPPRGEIPMKTARTLFGAALLSTLIALPAFASVAQYRQHYMVARTDVPLPVKVVSPTDLSPRWIGATVTLSLTVDASGQPRDIAVLQPADPELAQRVVAALAQWRFTPALEKGAPVARKIVLPVRLLAES